MIPKVILNNAENEDITGVRRNRKAKNRTHNDHKKEDKRTTNELSKTLLK